MHRRRLYHLQRRGRLGEVLTATGDGMATVRTANGVETVATALVDPVAPGELVLVHAGHGDQPRRGGGCDD